MEQDCSESRYSDSAEHSSRKLLSDDETCWIDDNYIFDLMIALSDLLHGDGYNGSAYLMERVADIFLYEVGRVPTPGWRRENGMESESSNDYLVSSLSKPDDCGSEGIVFQTSRFRKDVRDRTGSSGRLHDGLSPTQVGTMPIGRRASYQQFVKRKTGGSRHENRGIAMLKRMHRELKVNEGGDFWPPSSVKYEMRVEVADLQVSC